MALPEEPAKKEEDVHEEEMPTLQEIRPREEHLTTHKDTLEEVGVDVQEFNPRDGNAPRQACLETVWKRVWGVWKHKGSAIPRCLVHLCTLHK